MTEAVVYKRNSRNHLLEQIERFRVGDKNRGRDDDLLNAFCYGVAIALGDGDEFGTTLLRFFKFS